MSSHILEQMRAAFAAELLDLLNELDDALLTLEAEPGNTETVHRVFRAVHTIKGSGSTAGLKRLAGFAHRFEEAFDWARSGRLAVTTELVDAGLKGCDVLRALSHGSEDAPESAQETSVLEALQRLMTAAGASSAENNTKSESKTALAKTANEPSAAAFEIIFRPNAELFHSGADPIALLDEVRSLGAVHITAHTEDIPPFASLEPETCYLWWDIVLVTEQTEKDIRAVFSFVEDDSTVTVRLLENQQPALALLGVVPPESLELFMMECDEHLDVVESHALDLERDGSSRKSLDALFRAVHSIKGNSGLLLGYVTDAEAAKSHPLQLLTQVSHAIESTLEPYRDAHRAVPHDVAGLVLETRDTMRGLVNSLVGRFDGFTPPASLLERLGIAPKTTAALALSVTDLAFLNTASQCVELFENCLLRLEKGECSDILLRTYQRGLKTLRAAAKAQQRSEWQEPLARQKAVLEDVTAGGKIDAGQVSELKAALLSLRSQIERVQEAPAEIKVETPAAPVAASATEKTAARPAGSGATIRIDQDKLDRLMRVVGELLVARGVFPSLVQKLVTGEDTGSIARSLKDAGTGISRIAEELQASVMSIRMLPVKTVFQRFPRLVRDLARSLGKDVQLAIQGEDIELDKTILEQIADPLVHLVRNAVDHGLERPEVRQARGKQLSGRLTLKASNDAGHVVIEISDDGGGLDAEKLKKKAIEKELITAAAAAAMTTEAAHQLIFLPGFSTADKVTDVSGRGVGMDVVLNNIRSLQGSIDIRSSLGTGTSFSVKLPTSLMITKGILLEASGQEYILPLTAIRDMAKIPATDMHRHQGMTMAQVRGSVYSIVTLAEMFDLPARTLEELSVAVVDTGSSRYGLVADKFVSEVEVLVKPLASGLEGCKEFHGAAIMGDGRVVLVLNPQQCRTARGAAA